MSDAYTFPRERRHTLFFLEQATAYRPVYLDTEIDMSQVIAHRKVCSVKRSYIAYVIQAVGRVVARFPEANAMITGRLFPRLSRLPGVDAKFTLDKPLNGQRIVVSAVVRNADRATLDQIQQRLDYFKQREVTDCPEFASLLRLQRLPVWLGRWMFARAMRAPASKGRLQGSFAVTSLGHQPISRFVPQVGATLTLGVGAIVDRAVVVDGAVQLKPILNLTLAFDHRVLDGAISAEILVDIKRELENYRYEEQAA
ncbi:2-oxo acid dehydrogenase subunit E2 [Acidiferrobacter thiooxydans]|jgi:pyruvate/2-oxoglutarate dehydrogenase complex dihydrolipoamide acyltransferase (E2) component|uniref:Uncharacterized protein n=1 Tax=Acidiferrobacter thiooxydans TaxID=163359 RepID=A0A1C2G172_9GAMM|nr:2-oxo acid dehydrogenase subunit E2 [Acidiferrobacter thiooxydans]MDA8120387.1 2-oxo acid dehydrogenase subunit E2 [Gammaproteobacteria bacterium]MDA8190552.1 2-oxo acid dehydrogenase subunit E2 [Gammaproteobacteria bacterium]RCN56190.1 hypothetical protein C4900_10060 [Acidiferrobacter thiooxydans]UEN98518.1 2-oxo acid dehydrogenase subunit E2 [Acidiferrobacter thiooxydans]